VAKRVSLKGKGADLFFGDLAPSSAQEEAVPEPATPQEVQQDTATEDTQAPVTSRRQVAKPTSRQVVKSTSPQVGEETNGQVGPSTSPPVVKYTTHLRPETIKAVKRVAFESERKDYEIVQEALDAYLKRQSRG